MRAAAPLQVKLGGWGGTAGPTAYTGSAYLAGRLLRATGLECKPAGPKMRVQRGKDAALDQKKRSGAIGICSKRTREWWWGGILLSLNLHLLHGSHDLREELKTDYSKHLY